MRSIFSYTQLLTIFHKQFQTFITTHSTHISSQAPLGSVVCMTLGENSNTISTIPTKDSSLVESEISDLERYLDATRSSLLFARKVILVEGPAELFLIPQLVKHTMDGIDLDRLGISIVPIYGVHFDVYIKLFNNSSLPKKCAIIADGDMKHGEEVTDDTDIDPPPELPNLSQLENEYVKVFKCKSTFEKAITLHGTLRMLSQAAAECGAPRVSKKLNEKCDLLDAKNLDRQVENQLFEVLQNTVLNTAMRFGKARFAQTAAKYASLAQDIPNYIREAVTWLINEVK